MKSNWIYKQVSLYPKHTDNIGRPATYQDILFTQFGKDLPAIIGLRKLDRLAQDYKIQAKPFKAGLQCFTPASLLASKAKDNVTELSRSGIMQLDFDYEDIKDFDVEDLKKCVFNLPFVGFCGLSCSGYGFYALALIAEPERLSEYAGHCFEVLKTYGIQADESKGKKPENLRYISYDANMLIRLNPEPLRIKYFTTKQVIKKSSFNNFTPSNNGSTILTHSLTILQNVQSGQRWPTVQKISYSLGGLGIPNFLDDIKQVINSTPAFNGEEKKYCKCAEDCFGAGMRTPFATG